MKNNMGTIDRVIRILIATLVIVLYFTNIITGTLGIILLVVAGVFILTSILGFCPLYMLIDINTRSKK